MRAVIQRVANASVSVNGQVKGAIARGLVVLLAVEDADTPEDIEWLSGKIVRLRIFDDKNGVMNCSVQEVGGDILLISQFTLFASTKKGNRPSYIRSAKPDRGDTSSPSRMSDPCAASSNGSRAQPALCRFRSRP